MILIISGNLSFLNWLTILPSIFCFDDATLSCLFSKATKKKVIDIKRSEQTGVGHPWGKRMSCVVRDLHGLLLRLLCPKSVWLVSGTVARIP